MAENEEDKQRTTVRRGKSTLRSNRAMKKMREESGISELEKVVKAARDEHQGEIEKNVEGFFAKKKPGEQGKGQKSWETEGKGLGIKGELLTLEDLVYLKPYASDKMDVTVSFRTDEKMMRSFQRVKEASGGVYDILSDMYRDSAAIGLMILSERHKSILGPEIVVFQAKNHQRMKKEAESMIQELRDALRPMDDGKKLSYFLRFMDSINDRPKWIQETYLEEIRRDETLGGFLAKLEEAE